MESAITSTEFSLPHSLHLMTALAVPRPPFTSCSSEREMCCHLSGTSPQLEHLNLKNHLKSSSAGARPVRFSRAALSWRAIFTMSELGVVSQKIWRNALWKKKCNRDTF